MIVRESISFERGKDPKKSLFGGVPEDWWEDLAAGDKFKLLKDLPGLEYYKGYIVIVLSVKYDYHGQQMEIAQKTYNTDGEEVTKTRDWLMSFDFFKEYFMKI